MKRRIELTVKFRADYPCKQRLFAPGVVGTICTFYILAVLELFLRIKRFYGVPKLGLYKRGPEESTNQTFNTLYDKSHHCLLGQNGIWVKMMVKVELCYLVTSLKFTSLICNENVNYFSLQSMMTDKLTKIRHNFIR